jgi:hypothetical protein
MRRTHFILLGLLPAAPILAASCGQTPVPVGLVMLAPQAIEDAESVDLFVFDKGKHTCDAATGHVDKIPGNAANFPLTSTGCADGLSWCADIELEKGDTEKMFAAVAKTQGQKTFEGCTVSAVNQDPLQIVIEMKRFLEPKCCGDGKLQVGEQCDPGGLSECGMIAQDEGCFPDCSAQEVLLSVDDGNVKPYLANPPRTKSELAMAFCPGSAQVGTALRTVFRSTDADAIGTSDINLRVLSPEVYSFDLTKPELKGLAPLNLQLHLPMPCTDIYDMSGKAVEKSPAIAPVSETSTLIVYSSNEKKAPSSDIYLIEHTEEVCADVPQGVSPAVLVSVQQTASPGAITPDVARGPEGAALIVWNQQDKIVGRVWKGGVLTPAADQPPIPISSGLVPKVAGNASGWVVVYQGSGAGDPDAILRRSVDLEGKLGPEDVVNADAGGPQIEPDVAMLDDGSYVIVWQSAGDIFFQRYSGDGIQVKGDQAAPLNGDRDGLQSAPAVGAPTTGGVFFTAAWENDDGSISARFIGQKSGFLFNSITGQNDSFVASHEGIAGLRHHPAIAVGSYVAIGWQDDSDLHAGVFVRRFPSPK